MSMVIDEQVFFEQNISFAGMERTSDLFALVDREYTILKANESFAEHLEIPLEKIIGSKCYEILCDHDLKSEICPCTKNIRFNSFEAEIEGPAKASKNIGRMNPIFENTNFAGCIYVPNDTSTEKQLEIKLEDRLQDLGSIFNAMDDSVVVIDRKYRVVFMNQKARKSTVLDTVCENSESASFCYTVRHGGDVPCQEMGLQCPLNTVAETGSSCRVTHEHNKPHGDICQVEILASPLFDGQGNVIGVIEVGRDLVELQKKESDQEEHHALWQRRKDQAICGLISGMAHHYNNYLMGVIGGAEHIKELSADHKQFRQWSELILQASWKISELTKKLMLCTQKNSVVFTPQKLNHLVKMGEEAAKSKRRSASDLEPELELAEDLWQMKGDGEMVEEVIVELLINALESIVGGEGKIIIETRNVSREKNWLCHSRKSHPAGDYVYFSITDQGSGISSDNLPFILDPFYSTKFVGRGLGLAVANHIIKLHGGALQVESVLGKGTKMEVLFPRY